MDVLLIGFGKIGQIKAAIWESLGRRVVVFDPYASSAVRESGHAVFGSVQLSRDLIVDISTPPDVHLKSLKFVLGRTDISPRAIMLEKPVVSSPQDLVELRHLAANSPRASRVIVNESYYLSTALNLVAQELDGLQQQVLSIRAELSKNRQPDVLSGRYVDRALGPIGVELPHALAMVDTLGFRPTALKCQSVTRFDEVGDATNSGVRMRIEAGNTAITLDSFLGDFRATPEGHMVPNDRPLRYLEVKIPTGLITAEFDPVPGLGRYMSRVSHYDKKGKILNSIVVNDDHMRRHLSLIQSRSAEYTKFKSHTSLSTALATTQFLLDSAAGAEVVAVSRDLATVS